MESWIHSKTISGHEWSLERGPLHASVARDRHLLSFRVDIQHLSTKRSLIVRSGIKTKSDAMAQAEIDLGTLEESIRIKAVRV